MNHEITLTQTDDQWKQVMVCKFANATIAELVLEDTNTKTAAYGQIYLVDNATKLERDQSVVTVTCRYGDGYFACWTPDPNTNREKLEELAQTWQEQEQTLLPIMRYFEAGAKGYNDRFRRWIDKRDKELANLEHQIEEIERKLKAHQDYSEETNQDILDSLEMDFNQIERLWEALSQHQQSRFHFLERRPK